MADSETRTILSYAEAAKRRGSVHTFQQNPHAALFPFPLVPFEAMTHYDSWPEYPMSCGAIFRFKGQINRLAFDEATRTANLRHPLIEANIVHGSDGRLCWQPSSNACTVTWIGDRDATSFAGCHPFDMQHDTGVRLWVQQRGDFANVYSEFHHSCCDGAGGLSYMEDIFGAYANAINKGSPDPESLPPNNPARLLQRGEFLRPKASLFDRLKSLSVDFRATAHMATIDPLRLNSTRIPEADPRSSWQSQRFVTRIFDREHCARMRSSAAAVGATLNDYLLNALTVVIRDWNATTPSHHLPVRILVPVNLRGRTDLEMGLTNRMSYAFIDRQLADVSMDEASLKKVAGQAALNRRAQLPIRLLDKFALLQSLGLWSIIFSQKRCLATAVFSNLGDPSRRFRVRFPRENGMIRVGNLLMTNFEGTTALRPHTRAGLFLNTYGNQLTISVRLDPSIYCVSDAESFLDRFACQIDARPSLIKAA